MKVTFGAYPITQVRGISRSTDLFFQPWIISTAIPGLFGIALSLKRLQPPQKDYINGRATRIRTQIVGFGDQSTTIIRSPYIGSFLREEVYQPKLALFLLSFK